MDRNEYDVPLHSCHGYRHDGHYWEWIRARVLRGEFGERLKALAICRGA